jgi:hypothetical protein
MQDVVKITAQFRNDFNYWTSQIHKEKAKALPLHATKALAWRGGMAPTHSQPQH